jgi:hypothetical protein
MSFEKFVQRSTKGMMLFIAITMIIPLVLWGYMGSGSNDAPGGKEVVATIFGSQPVTKGELDRMRARATVDWWWKQYTGPNAWMMRFKRPDPPKPEELEKLAWENIVLLRDAEMKGIKASPAEIDSRLREMYSQLTGAQDSKGADEILAGRVRELFHSDLRTFEEWIGDIVLLDKLLETVSEAAFESYEEVYSQMAREQVLARAWYAGFDPKAFEKKVRASTSYEISRRYEANKAKYKVPAKASLTYLMADLEGFKKGIAEPSEGDVRKYYDDHRSEYALPDEHAPGEEHKPGEAEKFTPFEQAKAGIPDKIKTDKARDLARDLMGKVDRALGEMFDGKAYPPDAFEKLKAKFKDQGPELIHEVLPKFATRDVEELEKTLGTGSNLAAWAFDPKNEKGSVSRVTSTSKGVYLFRLVQRSESYEMGVTERVRESLERELRKDQVKQRASKAASELAQAVSARGMEAARRSQPVEWSVTRYFKTKGGDTGIEDRSLSQAVAGQAASLTPGKAGVVAGTQAGKPEWSYVVYLEDVVPAPETADAEFASTRTRLDNEKRRQFRETYPNLMVEAAKIEKTAPATKS